MLFILHLPLNKINYYRIKSTNMKKLFIFLFIIGSLSFLNQKALAQIPFGGYLSTIGPTDVYPTHLESLGQGGYRSVTTIFERDNITIERRKDGMLVYVTGPDPLFPALVGKFYQLGSISNPVDPNDLGDNSHWVEVSIGGAATNAWLINGNTIGNAGDSKVFLGSNDDMQIGFVTNGKEAFSIRKDLIGGAYLDIDSALYFKGYPILKYGGANPSKRNVELGDTQSNTSLSGVNNTFIGTSAGTQTTSGNNNLFLGLSSGFSNITGDNNTSIGSLSGPTSSSLSNTVALGYHAGVSKSNAMALGGTGKDSLVVGINTNSPRASLDINTSNGIIIPTGLTIGATGRPNLANTYPGMMRFNTEVGTSGKIEYADNSKTWRSIVSGVDIIKTTVSAPNLTTFSSASPTAILGPISGAGNPSFHDYTISLPGLGIDGSGTATANLDMDLVPGVVIASVRTGVNVVIIRVQNTTDNSQPVVSAGSSTFNFHITVIQ